MMKNNKRKLLGLVLALLLMVGIIPANASAETSTQSGILTLAEVPDAIYYGRSALAKLDNAAALVYAYDQIAAGIGEAASEIEVYNGLTYLTANEIRMVMDAYIRDYTGHFWLGNEWSYSFPYGKPDKVLRVIPQYTMSGSELTAAKAAFNAAVDEILSGITASMSDYEKELYLHDQLAARAVYVDSAQAHNAYGALVVGEAVCEGYAEAFQYLLQQVGIQSFIMEGISVAPGTDDTIGHAWNAVKIDGKFYHVDATWDDQGELLYHAYFNVSDAMIRKDHAIYGADYELPVCSSSEAFYFTGSEAYLETYTVETVAQLMKEHKGKVHVYIPGDVTEFCDWYNENWVEIAVKAGASGEISSQWSILGNELVLEIPQLQVCEHSYESVATAPTCTEEGYTTYTCTLCGDSYVDDYVDAKGHAEVIDESVAPDCTNTGLTEGKHCSVCDKVLVKQETVDALGHSYEEIVTQPTCTEDGNVSYRCSVCGDQYLDKVLAALGHAKVTDKAVAATCTASGLTEGSHCFICDAVLVKQEIVPAKGHDMQKTGDAVDATCETDGKTAVYTCANGCGKTEGGIKIDALGHDYKAVVTPPTCIAKGYTTYTCANCGNHYVADYTDIVAHSFAGSSCTVCGLVGGYCGTSANEGGQESVTWTLVDGVLTISGNGAMANYVYDKAPWFSYVQQINTAVIEDGVTSIGNYAFYYCVRMTSVTIPESVTNIGSEAFRNCSGLTSITIPNSVTTIGNWAFGFCTGLTSVTLPDSITCLELSVFRECTSLTAVTIPNSVTTIGNCAFQNCTSLSDITIPDSVTNIGFTAFYGCTSLTDVTIPNSVTTIGSNAFDGCTSLIRVTIPDSVTSLGTYAFNNCTSLASVTIGNGVSSIGDYTFHRCKSLTSITIPNSVTKIGRNAFSNCTGLTSVIIPEGVTSIGLSAFASCSNLTSVVIPESLTGHATDMFSGCTSLTDVYYGGTAQRWAIYNFNVSPAKYIHYEVTDPTDHWVEASKDATCEEDGYTRTECFCGYVQKETLTPATGHDMQKTGEAVAATCETNGKTAVYTCANGCGKTEGGIKIDALGHTKETVPGKAATCTETGLTDGVKCSVCGEVLVKQNVIPALDHNEIVDTAMEATCITDGKTEGKHCDRCGTVLVKQEVIPAKGHTKVTDPAVEADCTTTGLTEGSHCSVCGTVLVKQEIIPAKGHTEVVDEAVEATCKTAGLTEGTHCAVCETILVPQIIVEKLPHTEEIIPAVEATCTATGLTEGKKCSVCGEVIAAQEVVNVLGHTEEVIPAAAPSCTATGLTEGVKCSVCGKTLVAQEIVPMLGHTPEIVPGYAASCTETGLTDGQKCGVCGAVIKEQTVIPAKGHSWADGICTVCTTACEHSYPDGGGECTICGGSCAHDYGTVVTGPTCTGQGYTTYTCTLCGSSYKDDYVDAEGHSWRDATCTAAKTCSVCGVVDGEPNGHNYVSSVKAPSCTEKGYTTHTCTVCGDSYITDEQEPLGHTAKVPVEENRKEATCTEAGRYDMVVYCASCNAELNREMATIPAKGHTDGTIVIENQKNADCVNNGSYEEVIYCTVCDAELSRETTIIPVNGQHREENIQTLPGKAPTCTGKGLTEGQRCIACGETLIAQEEIAPKGHAAGETVIEKNGDGWDEVVYCSVCGEELSRVSQKILWGDCDGDGYVTTFDAALILEYKAFLVGADDLNMRACDVDGDGFVTTFDAALILEYKAFLIDRFPVEEK